MAQQTNLKKGSSSVLKRQRQNIATYHHNRSLKSAFRGELKKFIDFFKNKGSTKNKEGYTTPIVHKTIDKACTKGIISKNAASRYKARLDKLANNPATVETAKTKKSASAKAEKVENIEASNEKTESADTETDKKD